MFTAESIKLLAQDARRRAKGVTERDTLNRGGGAHRNYDQNIERPMQYDPETENPVTAGDDPDANIDPDDVIPSGMITPPPPLLSMPCSWWSALTFGKDDDAVALADAETCLRLVRARLEATVGRQAPQDARSLRLGATESQEQQTRQFGRSVAQLEREARFPGNHWCVA